MLKHRFFTLLFLFVLTTALLFSTAAAAPDGADGSTAEAPLTVPEEGYRHSGSAISGIDDTWLAEQKAALGLDPDSDAIYLHLEIPAEIDGQAIQSIAAKSFRDGTYQLVSADFTHASNLQSIGNQAFYTRSELGGTIDLSQTKLRSIADNYAFGGTGMTALILPETLSSIGSSAFYGCSKLASVTIPDGITSIGAHMFNGCRALESIVLPDSVTSIGDNAFANSGLTSIDLPDGLRSMGTSVFQGASALSGTVVIPASITALPNRTFSSCSSLQKVILPDATTVIDYSAFNNCSSMESICTVSTADSTGLVLPDHLTTIGNQAFRNCFVPGSELTAVIPASVETIGSEAFYSNQDGKALRFSMLVVERSQNEGLTGYDFYAFKWTQKAVGDLCLVVFPDAASYQYYRSHDNGLSHVEDAITYPYTAVFENGSNSIEQVNKLYGQPLQWTFDPDTLEVSIDTTYTLPEVVPPAEGWDDGYLGGWIFDNRVLTASSEIRYKQLSNCTDRISFTVTQIVTPPAVIPIVDGADVTPESYDVSVWDDGKHHEIGVRLEHPLSSKPAEPQVGDVYVDFQYMWTDVVKGAQGPRMGSSTSWPDDGFGSWMTGGPTISIEGAEHARVDGDYYLLEIEGYLWEYKGSYWSKQSDPYFKTQTTIIGGGHPDATTDRAYVFTVGLTAPPTHMITATAGAHGTITPDGEVPVTQGSNQTFAIVPDNGYEIDQVLIDGNSIGAVAQYTFPTVSSPHTITAAFAPVTYHITYDLAGGNLDTANPETYTVESATFSLTTPTRAGYTFTGWTGTGLIGPTMEVTIETGSTGDRAYTATWSKNLPDTYTIQATAGPGGTITPSGTVSVRRGDNQVFELTCANGYQIDQILVDGETVTSAGNSYTFENVQAAHTITVSFVPVTYHITYDLAGGKLDTANPETYTVESTTFTLTAPIRAGYTFTGWTGTGLTEPTMEVSIETGSTGDRTYTATWSKNHSGGGNQTYAIRAEAAEGGSIRPSGTVMVGQGENQTFAMTAADGYQIAEVLVDGEAVGAIDRYTFQDVQNPHTISVTFEPVSEPDLDSGVSSHLNARDHLAYVSGYPDHTFGPDRDLTRAEAAQMFYNLLLDQKISDRTVYSDVSDQAWYSDAVQALSSLGVVEGYPDGSFQPDRSITRSEFVAMAIRFANPASACDTAFTDVTEQDWFHDAVSCAAQYGWLTGYPDGSFRPYDPISRAEVTTVVNRMLNRAADPAFLQSHASEVNPFLDVSLQHWAYTSILEAANSHDYTRQSGVERWSRLF